MAESGHNLLTDEQWKFYEENGYVKLGKLLSPEELKRMQERINSIMLGTAEIDYNRLLMQVDSTSGKYEDAGEQSKGHKGATLDYRKIQDLVCELTFLPILSDLKGN